MNKGRGRGRSRAREWDKARGQRENPEEDSVWALEMGHSQWEGKWAGNTSSAWSAPEEALILCRDHRWGNCMKPAPGRAMCQVSFALNFPVTWSGERARRWQGLGVGRLTSISCKTPGETEGTGQSEGEKQRQIPTEGGGLGNRQSDKPRQKREELRETAERVIRTGEETGMIGRLGEKLREMSLDWGDRDRKGGRGRGKREREGKEDVRRGAGAAENRIGPNFEPLPTSELAILLSIFHLSPRQAERA